MSTQKQENKKQKLTLRIVFPDRAPKETECDSLTVNVVDNKKGQNGGLYGIRSNHAPAVFALAKGNIRAKLGEATVLDAEIGEGYAKVEDDRVTVISE